MKKILQWFRNCWKLDVTYEMAKRAHQAETQARLIARDFVIELRQSAENQLQMDIFQQALTNTFSEEQIQKFFDECDKLRTEHEKNSN